MKREIKMTRKNALWWNSVVIILSMLTQYSCTLIPEFSDEQHIETQSEAVEPNALDNNVSDFHEKLTLLVPYEINHDKGSPVNIITGGVDVPIANWDEPELEKRQDQMTINQRVEDIDTYSQLNQEIRSIDVGIHSVWGGVEGTSSYEKLGTMNFNRNTISFLSLVNATTGVKLPDTRDITLNITEKKLSSFQGNYESFINEYGTHFVAGFIYGGTLSAYCNIVSESLATTEEIKKDISASENTDILGFKTNGKITANKLENFTLNKTNSKVVCENLSTGSFPGAKVPKNPEEVNSLAADYLGNLKDTGGKKVITILWDWRMIPKIRETFEEGFEPIPNIEVFKENLKALQDKYYELKFGYNTLLENLNKENIVGYPNKRLVKEYHDTFLNWINKIEAMNLSEIRDFQKTDAKWVDLFGDDGWARLKKQIDHVVEISKGYVDFWIYYKTKNGCIFDHEDVSPLFSYDQIKISAKPSDGGIVVVDRRMKPFYLNKLFAPPPPEMHVTMPCNNGYLLTSVGIEFLEGGCSYRVVGEYQSGARLVGNILSLDDSKTMTMGDYLTPESNFYSNSDYGNSNIGVANAWLYNPSFEPGANIALGKKATQSSTQLSMDATRAVDGNTDGTWDGNSVTMTENDSNQWWEVDLGDVYSINNMVIYNNTDLVYNNIREGYNSPQKLYDYFIQVFDTNRNVVKNLEFTIKPLGEYPQDVIPYPGGFSEVKNYDINAEGRFIRITFMGHQFDGIPYRHFLSLAEVKVFGDDVTCPNDPNKEGPGICGCGVPDTDSDADGIPDCNEMVSGPNDDVLVVSNGNYLQEGHLIDHLGALGLDVDLINDYELDRNFVLEPYELVILTGFSPYVPDEGIDNIQSSQIPVLVMEYQDYGYSKKLGLVKDEWCGTSYDDQVEIKTLSHKITSSLGGQQTVYTKDAVLIGVPIAQIEEDILPLVYSEKEYTRATMLLDEERRVVVTGIHETSVYTYTAWRMLDNSILYLLDN